jgi:hypothetical protein
LKDSNSKEENLFLKLKFPFLFMFFFVLMKNIVFY